MNKYGQAAVAAVQLLQKDHQMLPAEAWETATLELFEKGSAAQKKGCPKNAFLRLCEEGMINGVNAGCYSHRKNSKNKLYAIRAVKLMFQHEGLANTPSKLWELITVENPIQHNSQLDVVLALKHANVLSIC